MTRTPFIDYFTCVDVNEVMIFFPETNIACYTHYIPYDFTFVEVWEARSKFRSYRITSGFNSV